MVLPARQVDLTNCDREPIHMPGSIQPHGVLLICDLNDNLIHSASANAAHYLGGRYAHIVGLTLSDVLGAKAAHNLRNALSRSGTSYLAGAELGIQIDGGPIVDASIHRHRDRIFVELEPASPRGGEAKSALDLTQALVRRISLESDVETLAATAAKLVRAMLGYDRVMVYRFLHNGAGQVIAEARRSGMHSFMGQFFPASDIPVQARRLYLLNWIRLIADVSYEPVGLVPCAGGEADALDMSHAHLRSVSRIHCEYLRNMGVAASLSISIVVDGKLWGLIACHHDSAKLVLLPMRISAELFGQYFSLQVAIAERREQYIAAAAARQRLDAIITSLDPGEPVDIALIARLPELHELVACDGVGLWLDGEWHAKGIAPPKEKAKELVGFLEVNAADAVWSTDDLRTLMGSDLAFGSEIAGMLAIPISGSAREHLILFRSEEAHNVVWAGAPAKQVVEGPSGPRLTPRGSFEAWREDVRGRSTPWTDAEIAVAEATRNYLRDVILRYKEATVEERARADRRRRLLNDELNHRVKNIIALVKSLALQSGTSAETVADYTKALEGRLSALAFAHDQSLGGGGGGLATLVEAEASLHRLGGSEERVATSGPAIGLDERAFGVMALLLHEMMTNAAKYGALSVPEGKLSIAWSCDADGNCAIDWRETDGPLVRQPERRGFGSALIENTIAYDLGGSADIAFAPEGLRARFVVPAAHVRESDEITEIAPMARAAHRPLAGKSLLLVEDQALIAMDVEDALRNLGASHIMSAPSAQTALAEIARGVPDCAVLDINLSGETSIQVADALLANAVPFIFATGYRESAMIPERFAHVPIVRKPMSESALAEKLATALQLDR
jgi:light-regulated signal transduction histidine kinase (bacteriophytochrome)